MAPAAQRQYSLRDMVLAQRAAFTAGIAYQHAGIGYIHSLPCDACEKIIVTRYPLPKVTRPRVIKDLREAYDYKAEGGDLYWRGITPGWYSFANGFPEPPRPTPDRVHRWSELLANPTEEVDAEE